jgi:uncharacterized DUF497 family protein
MQFEWDERKRRRNLLKHGIDFAALRQMLRATSWRRLTRAVTTASGVSKQLVKRVVSSYPWFTLGGVSAAG